MVISFSEIAYGFSQILACFVLCCALPVCPRNFRTVGNIPFTVSLDNRCEFILHRRNLLKCSLLTALCFESTEICPIGLLALRFFRFLPRLAKEISSDRSAPRPSYERAGI